MSDFLENEVSAFVESSKADVNIATLHGLKVNLIGDSYLKGHTMNTAMVWPSLLSDKYSWILTNYAKNGNMLSTFGNADPQPIVTRFGQMADNDPDIVIINGGRNDYNHTVPIGKSDSTDTGTFKGALHTLFVGLRKKYPNAMFVFTTVWNFPDTNSGTTLTYLDYAKAAEEICAAHGVYCFKAYDPDVSGVDMRNAEFRAVYCLSPGDISHLNFAGMKLVTPKYEAFLAECLADWTVHKDNLIPKTAESFIESRPFFCCGVELSKYRIVQSTNATIDEQIFSAYLRNHLKNKYGIDLALTTDSEAETAYELLIGKTDRTTIFAEKNQFHISASEGKVQFIAGDARGYESLCEYVTKVLFYPEAEENDRLNSGFSYTGKADNNLTSGTICASDLLGDTRIMFYNVCNANSPSGSIALRSKVYESLIQSYQPDVFGMQETGADFHMYLTPLLVQNGYTEVGSPVGDKNYTAMFYRAKTCRLLDFGWQLFSGPNNSNSKSISWGVFVDMSSGKRFIVLNAHFMYNQKGIDGPAARLNNAKESLSLIRRLQATYGDTPIVLGGDLNDSLMSGALTYLRNADGVFCAWDVANEKNDTAGYHHYATYDEDASSWVKWEEPTEIYLSDRTIDHAFVCGNCSVLRYVKVLSLYTYWLSDHMPQILDVSLRSPH